MGDLNVVGGEPSAQQIFDEVRERFILPEIDRRRASGSWPSDSAIEKFQVLMWGAPEPLPPEIRLNEEVQAVAKVRVSADKSAGEPVQWREITEVATIVPLEDGEDVNAAHVTALHVGNREWQTAYRFQFNRGRSREHLILALEYADTAKLALESGLLRPATENCLSSLELAVKAARLQFPKATIKRNPHQHLERWFHGWASAQGLRSDVAALLKDLNELRRTVRFHDGTSTLEESFVADAVSQTRGFIADMSERVAVPWDEEIEKHLRKR